MTKKNTTATEATPTTESPKPPKMTVKRRLAFLEGFALEAGTYEGAAITAALATETPLPARVLAKLHGYVASGAIALEHGAKLPELPAAPAEPPAQ